jgi:hypothetical protein
MKTLTPLLLAAMVSASGCCTMRRSAIQIVEINSAPDGATVRVAGETLTTPTKVALQRNRSCVVQLEKQGYKPVSVPLLSHISSEMWWRNLIWIHPFFWGLGWGIDAGTGPGCELRPSAVAVTLVPNN